MSINTPDSMTQLHSRQVVPLPVGSGGNNSVKQQMNETNNKLTMLSAQATADTKYDPPVPKHITKQVSIEKFTSSNTTVMLSVVGCMLIVYGIVAK